VARFPGATWRPINTLYLPNKALVVHNRMSVHISAGNGSPWGFFDQPQRASSQFFVYKTGAIEQFMDSEMQAEADLEGSDATHSVENEGLGDGPLTPEQVQSNARLFAWLREMHGIANQIATDSKVGESSHGLSWHRLGIDGNFPAAPSPLAGRTQRGGGMHYSTSRGKVCPGDAVVLQIPEIFTLSQSRSVDNPVTPPPVVVTPPPAGPVVIAPGVPAPPFPLPQSSYFGPKSGPTRSVSGFFSHREDLRRWQQRMADRGWAIDTDGLYGDQTGDVAKAFQREKHLFVDRLIGPETWGAAWTEPVTRA